MIIEKIKGRWNIFIGKLEQKLALSSNDEVAYISGKEHELLGRLQVKNKDSIPPYDKNAPCKACGH